MKKLYDGFVLIMVALVTTAVRDVVVFSDSIGIAQTAGEVGENISVDTVGVYDFPAANADVISVGDVVYWDAAAGNVTTATLSSDTVTTNATAGISWGTKAATTDGNVGVKIG